jgi:isoleucyl-tRNA synthetase
VKPNLPVLGPKLGPKLPEVRRRLEQGEYEELDHGGFHVDNIVLEPSDVIVERRAKEGWALAEEDGLTVAITTEVDDELRLEGEVLDLVHAVNSLRKERGLELTDRIVLTLPASQRAALAHEAFIRDEVLATRIELDASAVEPRIERA